MKHFLVILVSLFCTTLMAQDIEVKNMKQVKATPEASARKDLNGNACGLLRVKMAEDGAQFTGNIIGNVDYVKGEYLVYMTNGSKRLSIKHPNYLPITIVFSEYDIKKIESNTEYQMVTKLHREKQQRDPKRKGVVVFSVNPTSAVLAIDGNPQPIEGSGSYTVSIPYGIHYYSTTYENFTVDNQMVRVDKQPKQVTVDLTEFCPLLDIDCNDKDAAIYTNNEYRGNGKWNGLVPPGEYVIQARKDGFRTISQTVTLQENQTYSAHFDKLKPITGSMKVDYEPIGADVYVDGRKVGTSPCILDALTTGRHKLRISKEYCTDVNTNIVITEDQTLSIKGSLPMTFWGTVLNEAEKGDACAMLYLAYMYDGCLGGEVGWQCGDCYLCYKRFCQLAKREFNGFEENGDYFKTDYEPNYEKAIYWLKRAQKVKPTHTDDAYYGRTITEKSYNTYIMSRLSYCYERMHNYSESLSWAMKCYKEYDEGSPLAYHYYYGYGVQKNVSMAHKLYPKIDEHDDDYYIRENGFSISLSEYNYDE